MTERYEFTRSARKHRVGKHRALHVIHHNEPRKSATNEHGLALT